MDKTDILNKLASYPARWFLSFSQESGNSFLTSALKILFKNGLKASGDFAVENLRIDKQNYKVVRLDFSNLKPSSGVFEFRKALTDFLIDSFRSVGFSYDKEGTSVFSQLSRWLKTIPPCTLVLLIVDYDFPLTYSMSNEKLYRDVGYVLSEFYALLKSNDGAFRFLLITGVTDFRQTCLLNDLNHLTDLKRLSQGSLLGVSSDDLVRGFDDCLTQPSETVPTKNNNI